VVDTHKKQLTKCKHGRYEIMTEQIDKQELAVLETRTATIDDAINTLQVVDAESYTMAGTMLSEINEHIRFVQGKNGTDCFSGAPGAQRSKETGERFC